MAQKIAFATNKGGVTKTTSTLNVAGVIHRKMPSAKICIVDNDGQGSATRSLGIDPKKNEESIYDVFMGNLKPEDIAVSDVYDNIDLIPSNSDMNFLEFDKMKDYEETITRGTYDLLKALNKKNIDIESLTPDEWASLIPDELSMTKNYFNLLDGKFDEMDKKYDFILFDTPPELKSITSSVLSIADYVVIPFEPDITSLDGIINILERMSVIQKSYNPNLKIAGLLPAKVNRRTNLHKGFINDIMRYANLNDIPFFSTIIPNTIRFASITAARGLPATMALPASSREKNPFVAVYYDLVEEMISKGVIKVVK